MERATEIPLQPFQGSTQSRTLQLDWDWGKFKTFIFDKGDSKSKPIYIIHYSPFKPQLVFKSAGDNAIIGKGAINYVSINTDCELHGRPLKVRAMKRFKTEYTHLSYAFSETETPVTMTWTSSSDFKTWDFICLDPLQMPVAKFSANLWDLKTVGNIEFLGAKACTSHAVRDEVVVVGVSLMYCMAQRSTSLLSLFGALIAQPGRGLENPPADVPARVAQRDERTVGIGGERADTAKATGVDLTR